MRRAVASRFAPAAAAATSTRPPRNATAAPASPRSPLGLTGVHYYQARHIYDNNPDDEPAKQRADGNVGHTTIDFGGQWVMGRMLRDGHARQLYHRDVLRDTLSAWYPASDQAPKQERSDVEHLMFCFVGSDTPKNTGEP